MDISNMLSSGAGTIQGWMGGLGAGETQKTTFSPSENLLNIKTLKFKMEVSLFSQKQTSEQADTNWLLDSTTAKLKALEAKFSSQNTTPNSLDLFEDGLWGVAQTSDRLAGFVINGAGDDIAKIRQGREGIMRGFKEAEQIMGGNLPDISYATIERAMQKIDQHLQQLGQPIIDIAT